MKKINLFFRVKKMDYEGAGGSQFTAENMIKFGKYFCYGVIALAIVLIIVKEFLHV
jgi:hypothetical protein